MVEEMIKLTEIVSNIVWAVALIEGVIAAILLYLGYKGLKQNMKQKVTILGRKKVLNIIDYWKTAREECLNKKAIRDLFAEVGILIGGLIILTFVMVSIIIMPLMLIITPFSLLNRASKKWFQEKPQEVITKVYGAPGKGRMCRIYNYHCPNCGNTWLTNYNADVCNICGHPKTVKIEEHEYEMEE